MEKYNTDSEKAVKPFSRAVVAQNNNVVII